MKAIILAAGRGSRMKDMTDDRPKCLVMLRGKPLLKWQLSALNNAGISKLGIVTGYRREMLQNLGLVEFQNTRWADTNMVSSLECATKWLETDPCVVSYSDIFYDATAIQSLMESKAPIAVTFDPNWLTLWKRRFSDPLLDAETFRLRPDGELSEIGKKPKSIAEVQGQYMGLLRFTPEGWGEILRIRQDLSADEQDRMHMTETLQKVIEAGRVPVCAIPYEGEWGEIDFSDDLKVYQNE